MTPEDRLQISVAGYLDLALPVGAVWFHIANQRQTSARMGAKLKRMGVKPGVPDICVIWRGRVIFIELKTPTGRVSPAQKDMARWLTLAGAVVVTCRSVDEVSDFLAGIIGMKGRVAA